MSKPRAQAIGATHADPTGQGRPLPEGFTVETWAALPPEAQESIRALQAQASAAEAKYSCKVSTYKRKDGTPGAGIRIAWPSFLTPGAAVWLTTDDGRASLVAAVAALPKGAR